MGKGDKKTKKGKLFKGSRGKKRRKLNKLVTHSRKDEKLNSENKIRQIAYLYSYKDSLVRIISDYQNDIKDTKEIEKVKELNSRIDIHSKQLATIEGNISELRKGLLQFSVEELYSMYGKYDKFITINFHPDSLSEKQFGKSIMGVFDFNRRQRQDLNAALELAEIPRTNGYVKIKPSEICELDTEQVNELKTNGFLSGDIFEIYCTPINNTDRYKDKSQKDIPGTIEIQFDSSGFNPDLINLTLYKKRISNNNKPLIEAEWEEYYALRILYEKEEIQEAEWKDCIFTPDTTTIKDSINYYILRSKIGRNIELTEEEKSSLIKIIKSRNERGAKAVDKEVKRSSNASLKELIKNNVDIISELKNIATSYIDLNLSPYGAKFPVYLDLERYLHIFIRHFEKFQIGNWKGGKTAFQYNFEDTKRLIKIIIEKLQPQIDKALGAGKEFKIYDLKASYFNGNYYVVHIANNGRLLAFYPHENE